MHEMKFFFSLSFHNTKSFETNYGRISEIYGSEIHCSKNKYTGLCASLISAQRERKSIIENANSV